MDSTAGVTRPYDWKRMLGAAIVTRIKKIADDRTSGAAELVADEPTAAAGETCAILLAAVGGEPPRAAALRCDGVVHGDATHGWMEGSVCCKAKERRREEGVSMELAFGARLASLEGLAAVEKCSNLSGRRLLEPKLFDSGSQKGRSVQ